MSWPGSVGLRPSLFTIPFWRASRPSLSRISAISVQWKRSAVSPSSVRAKGGQRPIVVCRVASLGQTDQTQVLVNPQCPRILGHDAPAGQCDERHDIAVIEQFAWYDLNGHAALPFCDEV